MQENEKINTYTDEEKNMYYSLEDIQEKTAFCLSRLFDYFGSEGSKNNV